MNLPAKVAYNTVIQIISKAVATVLGLAAIALITRYLGREGFGEYTTAITFLSVFGVIADFGLTLVTVQLISRPDADEARTVGNLLALRLVSAVLIIGAAPLLILFFPYAPLVKTAAAVVSLAFLANALGQVFVGLAQKRLRMDTISIAEVAGRVVLVLATVLAIRLDQGLLGIVWSMVLANAAGLAIQFALSRRFARLSLRFEREEWKRIFRIAWPLGATVVLNLIYLRADTLLLSLIPRASTIGIIAEVGIYGAAYKVVDVLVTIPFMFAGIILPILTFAWAAGDWERFRGVLQRSFDLMAILAAPLVAGTLLVGDRVMVLVAGQEFRDSGYVLTLLVVAVAAVYLGTMFSHAIIAIGRQKEIIGAYAFTAATSLLGYVLVIPFFGYTGAAWTTIYSEVVIAFLAYRLIRRRTDFACSLRVFSRAVGAAILMAGAVFVLERTVTGSLIAIIPVAAFVYFLTLFALRGVTAPDLKALLKD